MLCFVAVECCPAAASRHTAPAPFCSCSTGMYATCCVDGDCPKGGMCDNVGRSASCEGGEHREVVDHHTPIMAMHPFMLAPPPLIAASPAFMGLAGRLTVFTERRRRVANLAAGSLRPMAVPPAPPTMWRPAPLASSVTRTSASRAREQSLSPPYTRTF